MTFDCSCFESDCWQDYFRECCSCCCDCNYRVTFSVSESCGGTGGQIHYSVDGGSEVTTEFAAVEFTEGHEICAWFEPYDSTAEATYNFIECVNTPCGTCTHSAATCAEYTSDTISFGPTCDAGGGCLCDSASQFIAQGFVAGMILCITGTSNFNDSGHYPFGFCRIASVAAGKICLELNDIYGGGFCQNAFNNEAAGATVTLYGVLPDQCTTDICFSGCGGMPDDAVVTFDALFELSGSCTSATCPDECDCFQIISVQIGTCAGDGFSCTSLAANAYPSIDNICNASQTTFYSFNLDGTDVQNDFCIRIITEWCDCDSGCTINFEDGGFFQLTYTGGNPGLSGGAMFIRFLDSGDPPCEIESCIPASTCTTLNYGNTVSLVFISDDEMNPTCREISCGGEAIATPLVQRIGNKLTINKKRYAQHVKSKAILGMLKNDAIAHKRKMERKKQ